MVQLFLELATFLSHSCSEPVPDIPLLTPLIQTEQLEGVCVLGGLQRFDPSVQISTAMTHFTAGEQDGFQDGEACFLRGTW